MFEGYKVPECTEEEVNSVISGNICRKASMSTCSLNGMCYSDTCALTQDARSKGVTQRYLDHRWPKDKKTERVAVRCTTLEEWDKVQRRVDERTYRPSYKNAFDERYGCPCMYADNGEWDFEQNVDTDCKIISAEEYLGEEGTVASYVDGVKCGPGDIIMVDNNLNKEEDMNATIAEVYKDKTYEEVVMVDKYFGNGGERAISIIADNEFGKILLVAHKDEVFTRAEELKAEEEAKDKE